MNIVFDLIIFGVLVLDGFLVVWLAARRKSRITLAFASLVWLVVFYGSFIEPNLLVVNKTTILLADSKSPQTLRVALVSDFHVGPYKQAAYVKKVVEKINSLKPNLILLGGDYVLGDEFHPEFLAPLKDLRALYGVYAIMGNHDYGEYLEEIMSNGSFSNGRASAVENALQKAGVRILKNASVMLQLPQGKKIALGGVDELWTKHANIEEAFKNVPAGTTKILLAHNPDIVRMATQQNIALVLAGHTHGGQIRLPLIGPVPAIPDELGRRYDRGLFRFGGTQLFITSGVGETGPRARLLVPPEITILNIKF